MELTGDQPDLLNPEGGQVDHQENRNDQDLEHDSTGDMDIDQLFNET